MNGWKDFARIAFFAAAAALPAAVLAGSFEEGILVTDRAESLVLPGESVLVQPEESQHEEGLVVGPVSESLPAPEALSAPCEQCGTVGCTSCGPSRSAQAGGHAAGGYFSRLLRPANPRFVAQVDALMLWQGNIASRPLYTDNTTGLTALDVNEARPAMAAGPRYGLFLNLDDCYAIEGNYFNVRSFEGRRATPPTTAGYDMNNIAGLTWPQLDAAEVITSGQIQSAELNWRRRQCGLPITWLAGFRWVEWNQRLQVNDVYSVPAAGVDMVNVVTGNDLYGGQAGMDVGLWNRGGFLKVDAVGKAGIFYNTAFQRTDLPTEFVPLTADARAQQTAFFGELGVNSSLRLTKWLSWRAGYSLFWISGVAIPASQLSLVNQPAPNDVATINTNGSVLLHGVTTGLEARW